MEVGELFPTERKHTQHITRRRFQSDPVYAAMVENLDRNIGRLLDAVEQAGKTQNTIVIFTSDNGPVVDDGYMDRAVELLDGHTPSGPLRGGKYSAFDAGTRVPFVVRWPGRIEPGTSAALISQVDMVASLAALTGQKLQENDGPDSLDLSRTLLGKDRHGRDHLVEQAGTLALIEGRWKYIEPASGPAVEANTGIELGNDAGPQLYDLVGDIGEKRNLAAEHPEIVRTMAARLAEIRLAGRSRSSQQREP